MPYSRNKNKLSTGAELLINKERARQANRHIYKQTKNINKHRETDKNRKKDDISGKKIWEKMCLKLTENIFLYKMFWKNNIIEF